MGIEWIKERIEGKKVLIVLDDVDQVKQLQALVGIRFGQGSRVIATTRDEQILTQLGVHKKYKVEELNNWESLRLFSHHAFKKGHLTDDYKDLSIRAVEYAGGIPLALEVLGCFLNGMSVFEWKSELEKLQSFPHEDIQNILRLSFKSLDYYAKKTFLDIACFFIGMDKEYAIRILHGCGFFPYIDLSLLIQRSLMTIDVQNKLRMHDLIRDMGRDIVCEMSLGDLGQLSRLWFHEDVLNVLRNEKGLKAVEGLTLNLPALEDVQLKTKAFAKMKNLRLLEINGASLIGCYKHLSKELRWLCWLKCPLKVLPQDFHLENLVVLDMQYSSVEQIWKDDRVLNKLKVLNLSYSKNLTKSPNFLRVPHLELLILEGCINLVELHESIGHLKGLVLLNLNGCKNFKKLPRSIYTLKTLERLNLSGCLKLDKLPEKFENMTSSKELVIHRTAIKQLPSSFGLSMNIKGGSLPGCKGQFLESQFSSFSSWISPKNINPISLLRASVFRFGNLGRLGLSNCSFSEDEILNDIGSLSSLQGLDLSENNFRKLPDCVSSLPKLQYLYLEKCKSLLSISELPANVEALNASGCPKLKTLSISRSSQLASLHLTDCCNLDEIEDLRLDPDLFINLFDSYNLSRKFRTRLLQCPPTQCNICHRVILLPCVPGEEGGIPSWFSHQRIGSSISFHVPSPAEGAIRVLLICIVYAKQKELDLPMKESYMPMTEIKVMIHNKKRDHRQVLLPSLFLYSVSMSDHLLLFRWPVVKNKVVVLGSPDKIIEFVEKVEMEVSFELCSWVEVKKCGVHIVVDESKTGSSGVLAVMDTTVDDQHVIVPNIKWMRQSLTMHEFIAQVCDIWVKVKVGYVETGEACEEWRTRHMYSLFIEGKCWRGHSPQTTAVCDQKECRELGTVERLEISWLLHTSTSLVQFWLFNTIVSL
ncbi:disease resistance protein RUN1-like [Corylus avellana]|uniref:disease resistance protein RUN1-like n=1 Tax=Corylus avellana TaxID=13451 RepID=UPI00286A3CB7|nr:disease resistance protein RUN1-like [Corylus avellana]